MARRRYLSTDISTDTRVNKLAMQSDFAALLYTWMIPHAGDNATLPGDPEELMLVVCPGRRDKEPEDVQVALEAIAALGLILLDQDAGEVHFPASFYKHQTYITESRRKSAPSVKGADRSPRISAEPRESTQNPASLKVSSSFLSSFSSPSCEGEAIDAADAAKPTPKSKPRQPIPDDFQLTDRDYAWAEAKGFDRAAADREFEAFTLHYQATGGVMRDWPAAFRKWLANAHKFVRAGPARASPAVNGVSPPGVITDRSPEVDVLGGFTGKGIKVARGNPP